MEGFTRVLTAPFCSDIPGLWDSSKTLHVATAGQYTHFRDLVPVPWRSKARSSAGGRREALHWLCRLLPSFS